MVLRLGLSLLGLLVVLAYALGSGRWVQVSQGWYGSLAKPPWQPPEWVFGAVWSYCFLMLAIVSVVVGWWGPGVIGTVRSVAWLALFAVTAGLGVLWSWLFYGSHALTAAALALTGGAIGTAGLLVLGSGISGWVFVAMLPYQAWLLVATSLSWGYVALNRPG